jgi:hypothetical protein
MAVPSTWATTQDVRDLTGVTVTDAQVMMATAVIETDGGARLAKLDPSTSRTGTSTGCAVRWRTRRRG